jgi:hypothetical protein
MSSRSLNISGVLGVAPFRTEAVLDVIWNVSEQLMTAVRLNCCSVSKHICAYSSMIFNCTEPGARI